MISGQLRRLKMFDCVAKNGSQSAFFECSEKSLQQDRNILIRRLTLFGAVTAVLQNIFETRQNQTTLMRLKEATTQFCALE